MAVCHVSAERTPVRAAAPPPSPERLVRERAMALGFDVVGFARADVPLEADHERFLDFVRQGKHGEMGYLAELPDVRRRVDTPDVLEGARTMICVGRRYARRADDEAGDPPAMQLVARYARGQDYHNHVRKRLRRLAAFVRTLAPGVRARPMCDVEPVLERAWAVRAGLGFVGKNGLVITPGQGSYQLLGEVVTTLELAPDEPMSERCGSCTRCLDACPTGAFTAPFVLDPRRCVSYWTIETRAAPPEDLRDAVSEHLFGCDVCQEVCPFNRTAPLGPVRAAPFRPADRHRGLDVRAFTSLDDAAFASLLEGSPLKRAGREGLARSAVLVLARRLAAGRSPDAAADRAALEAARDHADAAVREVAGWALTRGRLDPPREAPEDPGDGRD
jgi:epoxyqueuosine reductase